MKMHAKRLLVTLTLLAGIQLAKAQLSFTSLYSFANGTDGGFINAGLVQASDGYFYGMAASGGTNGNGTVFRLTTSGVLTPLHIFTGGNDGAYPFAGFVQASDGYLYGTASGGGTNGDGTVFRLSTNGAFMSLYSFTGGNDGANPLGTLVQANDGYLYGTASEGGTNGDGTVFRVTTNGVFTALYSFTGGNDGAYPHAGLVQADDGYLYGTAWEGGTSNYGTIFRITTSGVLTPLHTFTGGNDGAFPLGTLVQASDGNLYGTASEGSTNDSGSLFRFSLSGVMTILHDFTDGPDGGYLEAALLQASDGYLYGSTVGGGTGHSGVVFRITTRGALTPLYSFTGGNDGAGPHAGLIQANDGNLYGTTAHGGTNFVGTVFELAFSIPALNIHSGNQSLLFWPGANTNYVLQSTTNLASPNWVTVSNAAPAAAVIVTVTNSSLAQFFRLANP
jgi:uncharacterized repeat protein (TIGR03803 family)